MTLLAGSIDVELCREQVGGMVSGRLRPMAMRLRGGCGRPGVRMAIGLKTAR